MKKEKFVYINTSLSISVLDAQIKKIYEQIRRLEKVAEVKLEVGGIIRSKNSVAIWYYKILDIKRGKILLSIGHKSSLTNARSETRPNGDGYVFPTLSEREDYIR